MYSPRNCPLEIVSPLDGNHFDNISVQTCFKIKLFQSSYLSDTQNNAHLLSSCRVFLDCAVSIPFPSGYNRIGCMINSPSTE